MASNILSRFLPPATGSPSVYETLRRHDHSSDQSDIEERAGMALDEENLGGGFQDYELNDALPHLAARQMDLSIPAKTKRKALVTSKRALYNKARPQASPKLVAPDDPDDEVPMSLLVEDEDDVVPAVEGRRPREILPPVPGPTTRGARAKWQATQAQHRLHSDLSPGVPNPTELSRRGHPLNMIDPKEKALWRWANVENLDNFLKDVYDYFLGNGIWCILLSRILNLL